MVKNKKNNGYKNGLPSRGSHYLHGVVYVDGIRRRAEICKAIGHLSMLGMPDTENGRYGVGFSYDSNNAIAIRGALKALEIPNADIHMRRKK